MIPIIRKNFTNCRGQNFDRVREIAYKKGELVGNLGTFVAETKHEKNMFFDSSQNVYNGVYLYQTFYDPSIAYRIYKEFAEYGFNGYDDDKLIQQLRERQEKIRLSKFPTGVVTMDGKIIGQEIPYFPDKITLLSLFQNYKGLDSVKVYRAILDVLNEMHDNGIMYFDIHPKNFMVSPSCPESSVDVIDFDERYIKFDDDPQQLFYNYRMMINGLNEMCGIDSVVGQFEPTDNFGDAYHQLDVMARRLKR